MSAPQTIRVDLPAGRFRLLGWDGNHPPALFLHGLTAVAEVWGPTIDALGTDCPQCLALDQRGHGHSPKPPHGYSVGDYVKDAAATIQALGLAPVHLVGHSMGARVAMVLAARRPGLLRSVTIIDIGPEAWKANWEQTVEGIDRIPLSFPSLEAAPGAGAASRGGESTDAAFRAAQRQSIARARLQLLPDGTVSWLASREALKQTVIAHRSRGYWSEWKRVQPPALLIRGSTSNELRPAIRDRMREINPAVGFVEFAGIGHNVPLLAPEQLAATLREFWKQAAKIRPEG